MQLGEGFEVHAEPAVFGAALIIAEDERSVLTLRATAGAQHVDRRLALKALVALQSVGSGHPVGSVAPASLAQRG